MSSSEAKRASTAPTRKITCGAHQIVVAVGSVWAECEVERPVIGVECRGRDPLQPVGIQMNFDTIRDTAWYAQRGVQFGECACDPFPVRP